jgi:hypothetical protein
LLLAVAVAEELKQQALVVLAAVVVEVELLKKP